MKDKQKGWLLVFIQFVLLAVIIISASAEFKYINRPLLPIVHYIGVTLLLLGILLFMLVLITFGQIMTPNPVPGDKYKLNTSGLYGIVRHPMYFTVLVLITGIILYFQAFYSLIWIPVAFIFLLYKIKFEEQFLSKKFPEYPQYKTHTRKIIPFVY